MKQNVRKRPMTTAELFDKICSILVEKGKMPDILDYELATGRPAPITSYEYDLQNNLAFGGSEGIYLDLWMVHYVGGERCVDDIGTFKTLREDREAMHRMAALLVDFIFEATDYVNANLDDFTWEGVDVYPADESGKRRGGGCSCGTMEAALKRKDGHCPGQFANADRRLYACQRIGESKAPGSAVEPGQDEADGGIVADGRESADPADAETGRAYNQACV